jgi:hypothetical protein
MRGFTYGRFERPRKVELAQGGDFREPGDREIPSFQICVDVFSHPGQSASVESLVRALLEIFVGGETAMTMHQPRGQAYRQRFGQQPATGSLGPQFRNDRERDLGNQRVLETPLIAQRCMRSVVDIHTQAFRGKVSRREIQMQHLRGWRGEIEDMNAACLFLGCGHFVEVPSARLTTHVASPSSTENRLQDGEVLLTGRADSPREGPQTRNGLRHS